MSSEEILSSENENGLEDVTSPTSSEQFSENISGSEESTEESTEVLEESTETLEESTEVIYQVTDLTKVENSLEVITCFIIFFAVFLIGSMVYKLVKDIF